MVPSRYDHALERNLAELQKALLIRETLLAVEKHRYTLKVFTRVVNESLKNDYLSHAIKVFDRNSQSTSFWYLYKSDPRPIDKYAKAVGYSVDLLAEVSDKLKTVRNGTHFHIDSRGVLDPAAIWKDAAIKGSQLSATLDFAWGALSSVQQARGGEVPSLLEYTSADALEALRRVEGTSQ